MQQQSSRRRFVAKLGAVAAATVLPGFRLLAAAGAQQNLNFGYTAMTWGNDERQAIIDIASLGFQGIQFRANVVDAFKPVELRELLSKNNLVFTALSSGEVVLNADPKTEIAKHVANARYVKDCGGLYLQVLDKLTTYKRQATFDERVQLGKLLSEIGRQTADLGVALGYHNHLNTLSETPEGLASVLENTDSRYVKLELDVAHAVAGGGDPVKMIEAYKDRLLFLHLKDVVDLPGTAGGKYPFKFVELGHGRVDLPAVVAALGKMDFHGWAVVELDRVPEKGRTPKESAVISKTYMQDKLGIRL